MQGMQKSRRLREAGIKGDDRNCTQNSGEKTCWKLKRMWFVVHFMTLSVFHD
jgi:hypothetical protein